MHNYKILNPLPSTPYLDPFENLQGYLMLIVSVISWLDITHQPTSLWARSPTKVPPKDPSHLSTVYESQTIKIVSINMHVSSGEERRAHNLEDSG